MSDEVQVQATANEGSSGSDSGADDGATGDSYLDLQARLDAEYGDVVNNDGTPVGKSEEQTPDGEKDNGSKPTEKTTPAEPKKGKADAQQTAPIPKGYLSGYFKDGDDGDKMFDLDGFTKTVVGNPKTAWRYGERQYADAPAKQEPQQDPAEKRYEEEKGYRKRVEENFFAYRKALDGYVKQGLDIQTADVYATRDVQALINDHYSERDMRQRARWEEELLKRGTDKQRSEEVSAKARANISQLINEHGGTEKWMQFVSEGIDMIDLLFDLSNAGYKGTREETAKTISDWFNRNIASDMKRLRGLEKMIKGQIALAAIPWTYKQGRTAAQQLAKQNTPTGARKMGGRQGGAPAKATPETDALDMYLHPTRDRVVDTV